MSRPARRRIVPRVSERARRVTIDRPKSNDEQQLRVLRNRRQYVSTRLKTQTDEHRAWRDRQEINALGWAIGNLQRWLRGELPPRPATERERVD